LNKKGRKYQVIAAYNDKIVGKLFVDLREHVLE
jgi:hypothetical protein